MCKIVFGIWNFTAIFNRVDWNLVSLSQSFRCEPFPPVVLSNVCCIVFHFHQILISVVWLQRLMKFKKLVKLESLVRKTSHLCHFFIAENFMVPKFYLKLSYFRVLNTFVYQLKHILWGKGWSLPWSLHHNYLARLPLVSLPKTFFFQKKENAHYIVDRFVGFDMRESCKEIRSLYATIQGFSESIVMDNLRTLMLVRIRTSDNMIEGSWPSFHNPSPF